MVSKEFKELVNAIKKTGWTSSWDIPYNLLIDKTTGEPKQSPKNLVLYDVIVAVSKLPEAELKAISSRVNNELSDTLDNFLVSQLPKLPNILSNLHGLYKDYQKKVVTIVAKRERDAKKTEIQREKEKLILSLNRKDIADSINKIKKSMEPYIVKGEKSIETTFRTKEKELVSAWKVVKADLDSNNVEYIRPTDSAVSTIHYTRIRGLTGINSVKEFILKKHRTFANTWFDNKLYQLNTAATYILGGQVGDLINQFKKRFRDGEDFKVELLFHRLIKLNPTLRDYTLAIPYNGREFRLTATDDRRVKYTIDTNTITAGGYNIQRLHTRWLVQLRNSDTGKIEKFTIDDKSKT
jgi:hypothetical protein